MTSETQEDEDDSDSFVEVPESDCEDDERYTMWRSLVLSTAPSGPFPYYDCEDNDYDDDDDWYVEVTDDDDTEEDGLTDSSPVHLPVVVPTTIITPPTEELNEAPKEESNEVTYGGSAVKLTSSDVSFIIMYTKIM